jgi:hypothetical protein
MVVARNPSIEAAVHGVEAHFIANKDENQADYFNLEGHVHSVLGQKRRSACGLLASRLHNQNIATHLKNLVQVIQNKWHGMLSQGVVMIHDNARPHTAAAMQHLIVTFAWEQFDHPSYSPDIVPSDFYLFLHLKSFLADQQFHKANEVKEAITTCFASQVASFYDEGTQKLVQLYDKCLNNGGNYVKN